MPKLTEAQLSRQVQDFLKLDGWRVLKQEPLSRAGGGRYAGELGMADLLAIRYANPLRGWSAAILWLEIKSAKGKVAKHQAEWHAAERARGGEVWIVSNFEAFKLVYCGSGLNRSMR